MSNRKCPISMAGLFCCLVIGGVVSLSQIASADVGSLMTKAGNAVEKTADKNGETAVKAEEAAKKAFAEDPDDLLKQAKSDLRSAENNMFNGKKEEAIEGVIAVADILYQVREIDPDHAKLAPLIQKTEKLRKDLQRRTGKTIALKTDPDAPDAPEAPESPEASSSPGAAKAPATGGPDALARQANDLLRQAESDGHNGRYQEAKAKLDQAGPVIEQLRAADPNHKKLMSLDSKLGNQTRAINKRLAPSESRPAATVAGSTPSQPSTSDGKLPYHTRNIVNSLQGDLSNSENYFEEMESGSSSLSDDTLLGRAATQLKRVEEKIPAMLEQAEEDGVADDPRVTAIAPKLAELKARVKEGEAGAAKKAEATAASAGAVEGDVVAITKTRDRLRDEYFDKCGGGVAFYYNELKVAVDGLACIEKFEKTEQANAQKELDAFTAKYGSTEQTIEKSTGNYQGWFAVKGIREGIANIAATRVAMSEDLVSRAESQIDRLPQMHDFSRLEAHETVRAQVRLAQLYSPDNDKVKPLIASVEESLKTDEKAFNAKIDAQEWPGSTKNKNGEAGVKYFEESKGWGQRSKARGNEGKEEHWPIAVSVTGDWVVVKRNLLKEPTMYGLPALVAIQLDSEKKLNLTRVYEVTMRTSESANAKKEPPFTSESVGGSYYIRPTKIK